MSMKFREVFKDIQLDARIDAMMEQVTVEKLVSNTARTNLRIYLTSERLIQRKDIISIENEIEKQLFYKQNVKVKIFEKFNLSSQYTPETLFNAYEESILYELRQRANVDYFLFHDGTLSFKGERVKLTLEDSVLAREKEAEIVDILDGIFNRKCNMDAIIEVDYAILHTNRFKEENEHKLRIMIEEITKRAYGNAEDDPDSRYAEIGDGKSKENKNDKQKVKSVKSGSGEKENFQKKTFLLTNKDNLTKKNDGSDNDKRYRKLQNSDDPDVLYGKNIEEEAMPISDITDEIGIVVIRGKIIATEGRELRNEKYFYSFAVTDFTDTIVVKIFSRIDEKDEIESRLKKGLFVKLCGEARYDNYAGEINIGSVKGIRKIKDFTVPRVDSSLKKRVELHCHTKMSDSDGVSYAADIIKRAEKWGMSALAITDHGCVQAFPEAFHTTENMPGFKVLYGVEGYLVDDMKQTVIHCKDQTLEDDFVVFDIETTGFSPVKQRIIEIGAVKIQKGEIVDEFSSFVNPQIPIPFEIENLTHITDDMVKDAPLIAEVLPEFLEFCKGCVLVAHNANFDMSFIIENAKQFGLPCDFTYVDTMAISRSIMTELNKHTLDSICKHMKINLENHHRAVDDARATAMVFQRFIHMLKDLKIETLKQLNDYTAVSVEKARKLPYYHIIILAKNEVGRVNLYRMVSESHVTYYNRRPKLPRSVIEKYREGVLLGSACEAGELYRAILEEKTDAEIAEIVNFYDYLEIQPLGNNKFMIDSQKHRTINTFLDLININKRIVALGDEFKKPVCATCDVHFLDPEDEIYRRIIMAGKNYDDADDQPPLYFRTTEEMLQEFEYLGSEKAEEVVITNTNLIADMCEYVSPIHPDKCPPVIPHSDEMLRTICYTKAHEMYGEELPKIVEERLERELKSIIGNGFAVMYIIAQKLVWKSNEDGYLVGSRGSVGSSFVATMAGITEVNPLSPHYYCSECHYSDFDSEEVLQYSGRAGCDMPDKICPNCGATLKKDGFDIPFETFLGFYGDKEPDIDLNFSGEYQSKAHKYTEVIFGAGQTFRAGTIGTLADKTAYGYVKKYYEERGIVKRKCEIERIASGCVDVRRTTGQHPGGIIVLPLGYDINQFTPIQRPANDMTTDTITTHFDYHSIDHNLLKLDILGHDDPSMIRMLQDLTGMDPLMIPLDDKKVMSLFQDTSALGVTPEQIRGCKLGSLGIPEFGTDFAMQMLIDTHPTSFSDLVRIAGLSHGTDVWLGNAQTLIEEGKATISTAICTRDDIMVYLISKGLEPGMAFNIMENVRKGKVAKGKCDKWPEWKEEMMKHDVPDWYIWSCEKIMYMFPKAHAAAYVMMAWRIAYCKVNFPLAYYASFFSIRASAFSYELMCQGQRHLELIMDDYKKRENTLTNKEQDALKDMRIVQEMYARGFEFEPIDIFRAHPKNFQIIDGKIMPSLISIDGLAEKAAEGIVEACKNGPFLSKDDFRERTKVSKTVVDTMADLGLLGSLPESNQIRLFDMM